ncbi:PH domain-containing protein [Pradoshia sp. D12]|uniref:PH domain-containing protein n=1 Tax=Bacillaceae TaxID=186817 RepID=UPI00080ADC08|nr:MULTISPECIES: PH domain-containing protein [Bacillaceae]OCA84770.1 hypothetical protein A8L44_10330 [Bacillus sp. FJAT-27986]QFK72764.1 PH domain-containing protein [Pradoshia sp. D12]TPF71758.1 hypothetical protein FHY44_09490 [Bacillus sp. D12]
MYLQIQEPTQRISKDSILVWRLSKTLGHGATILVAGVLWYLSEMYEWKTWITYTLIVLIGLTVLSAIYEILFEPYYKYKTWRYEIDEEYVQLKRGHFIVEHIVIPMAKVEYVSTHQGPFLRKYQLYDVEIGTTTTNHTIPAIPAEQAIALREQIAIFAKVKDRDEKGMEQEL